MKKIKKIVQKFLQIFRENWKTALIATAITEIVFWCPVWLPVVVYAITEERLWLTISTAYIAFWLPPITPGWLIQIGSITLITKGLKGRKKNGKRNDYK